MSDEPAPLLERLLLACALLCIGLLLLILTDFDYGRDQGVYAVAARSLLDGGAPYADAWDVKPPMIFFVYALARVLFGADMHAIRLLEAAGFASLVWAFVILSRRHVGSARAGIVGGLLAVSTHVQLEYWHTGQPESFAAVATAWALVCATFEPAAGGAEERRRWLADFAAGALYTTAALFKPPLGGGFLVSLVFALRARHGSAGRLRGLLAPLSAYLSGASLVLACVVLFFVARGAWPALVSALFEFAPHHTALSFQAGEFRALVYRAVEASLFDYSAYLPVGIALLLALPRLGERERRGAAHVALVCALQLIGIGLQAKFFDYHFGATLPLLALLAGWGLWKLWLLVRPRPLLAAATLLALLALCDVHPTKPLRSGISFWERSRHRLGLTARADSPALRSRLHSQPDFDADANRRVAEWIREHTSATDSVYIWGFEPVIYEQADRRCASRFIYNVPQRLSWPGRDDARRELLEELRADPPAVFVVAHGDVLRLVTGNRRDSAGELAAFAALRELLERSYRRELQIGHFTLYLRRPAAGSPDPSPGSGA